MQIFFCFFCSYAKFFISLCPKMKTIDLNKDLLPFINRYEQICLIGDKKLRERALPIFENIPILWLEIDESKKSLDSVTQIWDFLFEHNMTRRGLVVVLGGGVLTDMVGFAAATYKRGIDYINIPTTLLGMIDASTGGKTGINFGGLKNEIGVFNNALCVILDTTFLHTMDSENI